MLRRYACVSSRMTWSRYSITTVSSVFNTVFGVCMFWALMLTFGYRREPYCPDDVGVWILGGWSGTMQNSARAWKVKVAAAYQIERMRGGLYFHPVGSVRNSDWSWISDWEFFSCPLQFFWNLVSTYHYRSRQTPPPRQADSPLGRHPRQANSTSHPPGMVNAADGTHPTGMHSCFHSTFTI